MAEMVKVIKTLPHLSNLYISENQISAISHIYSKETFEFLENLEILEKKEINYSKIKKFLENNNYQKVIHLENKQEYVSQGDIITFWPIGYKHPVRLEFFDEELESLYTIDELYNTKLHFQEFLVLSDVEIEDKTEREDLEIHIPNSITGKAIRKLIIVASFGEHIIPERYIVNTDFTLPPLFYSNYELFKSQVKALRDNNYTVIIKSKQDLEEESDEFINNEFNFKAEIPAGVISENLKLAVFTDREIFGSIYLTRPEKAQKFPSNIQKLLRQFEGTIEIGDYIVHEDYGIGIYSGLTQEKVGDTELEYLLVKYAQDDELYVPLNQIEKITKYIGTEGVAPRITRLGRASWEHVKEKIKKSTTLLAKDLVEHYAKRELAKATPIDSTETKEYLDFVNDFAHTETSDQLRATSEILADLSKDKPMDRLLVGDVGFGKTEVIMRAAFKAVEMGGQVAILSPTTVLTRQHFDVFQKRFKNFPITIGFVSRFNTTRQNSDIINKANQGKIDILIGTHRLLGNDVNFKNLQLVVVDEEQRFGVAQKEKIKKLNYSAHLLSVSATPIPRTLSMALSSLQSLSIITTAPVNRKSIKTEIVKDDWNKIAQAIILEVQRGGQVYFLNNEVQTILSIKDKLENLCPNVRFGIAHGQMNTNNLDKVMTDFYDRKYDCLIATTIIENGLDMPNVNTIVINKAHKFGLSQLYQLRGRVGRSGIQAYCYLLYEGRDLDIKHKDTIEVGKVKRKVPTYISRLQSLVENQDLGAGFRIASRDLEIRGAGNLLGDQQSGHIATIGYALYIEILAEEIERLRSIVK